MDYTDSEQGTMSDELSTTKERAESTIDRVERCLPKWNTWYPKENSLVEIPRADLLALMHFAKIGLREERNGSSR